MYKYLNSSSISDNNNIINSRHSSGSARIYNSSLSSTEKIDNKSQANPEFGSYLAGLIEGDGSIAVHDSCSKSKKYSPKILIVFHVSDMPLAEHLQKITECGKVYYKKDAGYVIWQIQDLQGVLKIINYINGFLRTGKIVEFHRAIQWCNDNLYTNIKPLPINNSSICSDGWLAGFVNKNSSFSTTVSNNSRVISKFKIKVNVIKSKSDNESVVLDKYFKVFCRISEYLKTSFITTIKDSHYKKCTFIVYAYLPESKNKVIEYFSKYPLLGKISLDYDVWNNNLSSLVIKKKLFYIKSKIFSKK